jgi:hypothetical protein
MSERDGVAGEPSRELSDLFDLAINECVKARRNHAMHPFLVLQEGEGGQIIELAAESIEASIARADDTIRRAAATVRAYAIAYESQLRYDTGEPLPAFLVEVGERSCGDGFVMFHLYEWIDGEIDLVQHSSRVLRRTKPRFG